MPTPRPIDAPWILFERGERKEDRMRPLFVAVEARGVSGLVAVGVAQERTTGWKGTKRALDQGGFTFGFSRVSVHVNQHYCYIWDANWEPPSSRSVATRLGAAGST